MRRRDRAKNESKKTSFISQTKGSEKSNSKPRMTSPVQQPLPQKPQEIKIPQAKPRSLIPTLKISSAELAYGHNTTRIVQKKEEIKVEISDIKRDLFQVK